MECVLAAVLRLSWALEGKTDERLVVAAPDVSPHLAVLIELGQLV
jgi:hypothetical protein